MDEKMRTSGIDIIGNISCGTHFCQFYQTKEDLMDIIVPYLMLGRENNESSLWVKSQLVEGKNAKDAFRTAIPDFENYLANRQIEFISYPHWYLKSGSFDSD